MFTITIFPECAVTLAKAQRDESINTTILVKCTTSGEAFDGWYFEGKKISDQKTERVHTESVGDVHTMTIQHIKQSDGGDYECRGQSGSRATFTLHINGMYNCTRVLLFLSSVTILFIVVTF